MAKPKILAYSSYQHGLGIPQFLAYFLALKYFSAPDWAYYILYVATTFSVVFFFMNFLMSEIVTIEDFEEEDEDTSNS